ncbi:GNAT family N-acetyltransferase [Virgibacillus kimchii]
MEDIKAGNNKFYVGEEEENPLAEITFDTSEENNIVIDHTYVSSELRGQGMAGKLVDKAVKHAREKDKKIVALCPYAKSKIEKTPEHKDILVD